MDGGGEVVASGGVGRLPGMGQEGECANCRARDSGWEEERYPCAEIAEGVRGGAMAMGCVCAPSTEGGGGCIAAAVKEVSLL